MVAGDPAALSEVLVRQAERLLDDHDHLSRVIANLHFPVDAFEDQSNNPKNSKDFEGMIRLFLYKEARGLSQNKTSNIPRVYFQRFGVSASTTQQCLSYTWNKRFTQELRTLIETTATGIRGAAREHDVYVVGVSEDDEDEDEDTSPRRFSEQQVTQTTRFARQHAFSAFDSGRADNAKYSDTHILEVFSHMAMAGCGTEQGARRNGRSPFRDESPHHSTMLRVLKQMGTPDQQRTLSDFTEGRDILWERTREAVLDPFDTAIGRIIDRVDGYDAFTQPVVAAIDITTWQFWPYPYTDEKDENGDRIPKEDYPDMVSGTKEESAYAYKMATLTIVGNNVPLILAVEPVKDDSEWDDGGTLPRHEVVGRLLDRATEHVDIHMVLCDREFDVHEVGHEIDKRGIRYLIPKKEYAKDYETIKKIEQHDTADIGVLRNVERGSQRSDEAHTVSIMYVPSRSDDGDYQVFVTNRDVPAEDVPGVVQRYDRRWEIENEYKTIKDTFLPNTSSKSYRLRFVYFALACVLYNVWRLTDYLLKDGFEGVGGDYEPYLTAGEFTEVLGLFLPPVD